MARASLVAVVCGTLAVFATSAAAFTGPQLRVDANANTTVAAGGTLTYLLQFNNTGDSGTTDPISLTVTLPPQMTVAPGGLTGSFGSCTPVDPPTGLSEFSCSTGESIPAHRSIRPVLTVAVAPGASGSLTSTFVVSAGAAGTGGTSVTTRVSPSDPPFGLAAFDGQVTAAPAPVSQPDAANPADAANFAPPFSQAGGHPYAASTTVDFNTLTNPNPFLGPFWPVEPVKDVVADLPPGFLGNPTAAAKCTVPDLAHSFGTIAAPTCAPTAQVGTALVRQDGLFLGFGVFVNTIGPVPVYDMVAPPDVPARFGFNVAGTIVTFDARVRSDSDYGASIVFRNTPQGLAFGSTTITLWGVPADASHDGERGCSGLPEPFDPSAQGPTCPSGASQVALLRNPTRCTAPAGSSPSDGLTTTLYADSWDHPARFAADGGPDLSDPNWKSASFVTHNPPAYPGVDSSQWGPHQLPTGCDKVPFDPTVSAKPQDPAIAGQPSGFVFDVNLPQTDDPIVIGESDLKKAVVTLPEGVRVAPGVADGLQACSPAQIGLLGTHFADPNPIRFNTSDPTCPRASRMGSLTITTPLLDQPATGSIYLATPHDNPFGTLTAIYLVAKASGVILKIPGEIDLDPNTGQITARFDNSPQLPFSNLHLVFEGGARAPLVTPDQCGTYTTQAQMYSWSQPDQPVEADSQFTVSADGNGAPCPPRGFTPHMVAGTTNPIAGKDSPFQLSLTRSDLDQELAGLTVDMATGLTARIANATLCSDAAANAGTCGDASKIGSVTTGAGAGTNPFYITNGRVYLTGPYKGAPFGLSIVVPAVAGPFDLGNVVVRSAVLIDRHTAQVKVVSDPLPTILQGIPLDVRDVRVNVDRPHFFVNPTSCAVKHILGTIGSVQGAVAHTSTRFQALECANLSLAPKLSLTVGDRRHTRPGISTPLTATLTQAPGQSNLKTVSVTLPGTIDALLPVINRACTRAQFDAGKCSSRARAGSAVAVTPLLRDPLRGPAYFVKNGRPIPDLMVALRGQVAFDLDAHASIPGGKRLATTFIAPDTPISKFTLRIVSGHNGPLGVVTNLCTAKARTTPASVSIHGQNGRIFTANQRLHIVGCRAATKAKKSKKH